MLVTKNEYWSAHKWINRVGGKPSICEKCGKTNLFNKKINWANKSHLYKKDLSDWMRLCHSCHKKYDMNDNWKQNISFGRKGVVGPHRQIEQLTKEGFFIKRFFSAREAEKELGISYKSISNVLVGRSKTAGGYLWV